MLNKMIGFVFILFLMGCKGDTKSKSQKIAVEIAETLRSWNLDAEVHQVSLLDTLRIEIYYSENAEEANRVKYYLDRYSNELIINTLVQLNQKLFDEYNVLYFYVGFEGVNDIGKFYIDREKLKQVNSFFNNPLVLENIIYNLEHFTYADIIVFDSMIKNLTSEITEINYEKNYWELVRDFSLFCSENEKGYTEAALVLILMDGYLFYYDFDTEPKEADVGLLFMINKCGLEKELIDKNIEEIRKELGLR